MQSQSTWGPVSPAGHCLFRGKPCPSVCLFAEYTMLFLAQRKHLPLFLWLKNTALVIKSPYGDICYCFENLQRDRTHWYPVEYVDKMYACICVCVCAHMLCSLLWVMADGAPPSSQGLVDRLNNMGHSSMLVLKKKTHLIFYKGTFLDSAYSPKSSPFACYENNSLGVNTSVLGLLLVLWWLIWSGLSGSGSGGDDCCLVGLVFKEKLELPAWSFFLMHASPARTSAWELPWCANSTGLSDGSVVVFLGV